MIDTKPRKWTRVDWWLLGSVVVLTGYAVWLVFDDDEGYRQVIYLRTVAKLSQAIALHFGEIGLAAEVEYHRLMELEHIC